uniref:Uncharacterized protein n=1 Tax=Myoviridae sp. ctncN39 TaxID=2825170 RepID=A0A8S5V2A2_9CAUD|nr:MAG TPA: hypothetical protein [Myoviridae sp. ctncN39]
MMILLGIFGAAVLGLAGVAVYLSGVDVGRENARRELEGQDDTEPTLYLKITTKGSDADDNAGKGD